MVGSNSRENPKGPATMSSEMPHASNYYRWLVSEMTPFLGRRILDIGGGYGAHLEYIIPDRECVMSIDFSAESIEFMRSRFRHYAHFEAKVADFSQSDSRESLIACNFDSIVSLNVLEHIEDDLAALARMHAILHRQRGILFLQVPAHQWLYGTMDDQAGHYRRYDRKALHELLTQAGFETLRLYYLNSLSIIPWFVSGRLLKRDLDADSVNLQIKLFDHYIVAILRQMETLVRPPFGQSLIAVARA